jgi:hypothetical protein
MRRYLLILFITAICHCVGCQGVTNHVKRSLSTASEDYRRMTTGSSSSYIAGQRSQP